MWAAARAVELDSTDALGYALRGWGVFQTGEFDRYPEALADARRAHEMNPNDVYGARGFLRGWKLEWVSTSGPSNTVITFYG